MQISHLSEEAQRCNDVLRLQITPHAVETMAEVGRLALPVSVTPPELVSVTAYVALGLPQSEIAGAMGYSVDTLQRRIEVIADVLDVPRTQPAIVRGAFRYGLLDVGSSKDVPLVDSWPIEPAGLSEKQGRVMDGVSLGLDNGEIAATLGLRHAGPVKGHREKILRKWNASGMSLAVTVGHHIGFFESGQLADDQTPLRPRAMAMSASN